MAAVTIFLANALPLPAQALDRGDIAGTIRDQTGAVLTGVTVTLRETRTGAERVMVTSDDGRYSAPLMSTGVYVVQTARPVTRLPPPEDRTIVVVRKMVDGRV
jgi:hypothetical protein